MRSLRRTLLAAVVAAIALPDGAIAQLLTDHLLVYAIKAGPAIPVTYRMDLAAVETTLSALGCRLKAGSRARQLLVPVEKRDVTPVPPAPQIRGGALGSEYLCYRVKCSEPDSPGPLERQSQFLAHRIDRTRIRSLCVPVAMAEPPTSTTTPATSTTTVSTPGCAGQGESCAAGETCCEGLVCCAGIPVPPGQEFCGTVCPISDRNRKESFEAVDRSEVLHELAGLEITTWRYKSDPENVRHLGPMAQDFKAAFGLGASEKAIFLVDANGVALAAIQALNDELESVRSENAQLRRSIDSLEKRLERIEGH